MGGLCAGERLTAVVHRRAETGGAECERRFCVLLPPPFRPSPPVPARCLRCLGEAVAQRRRARTPDSGGAQAGGVSPPFTVCAHSWLEVFGVTGRVGGALGRGREHESGAGGGRERNEWQVWCPRRRIASLGPVL